MDPRMRPSATATPARASPAIESATKTITAVAKQPTTALPGPKIHDRVFGEMDDVISTSVDFFVADAPALVTESKNLADAKNAMVGVGAVRGDSGKYGRGKYWVVVIYAATK